MGGDNDSLLRLVQVRDLIGGQGWYDLHQYRMGPEGGFVMHWSRVVDAPIAAIILFVSAMTASMAVGETAALVAWPLILMGLAMAFLLRIARTLGGGWATLPILTIGGAALYFIGVFAPATIDHHNVQLMLTLAAIAALATGQGFASGLVAGAASALMLTVGMETVPYVAVAGLTAAIGFLVGGERDAAKACGFGAGFSALGLAAFVGTVPANAWLVAQCDSYSIPQFTVALVAGAGLALVSSIGLLRQTFARRLLALAVLGVVVATIVILFFPQCLAAPYADLDPRLKKFWLDSIAEAQPLWSIVVHDPASTVSYYVTPVIGLIVLGLRMRATGLTRAGVIVMAFLATAFAVSIWQVRGGMFSIPLAAIPLAGWVGDWRCRVAAGSGKLTTLKMVLAWIVSLNLVWAVAASAVAAALESNTSDAKNSKGSCEASADFAALATMPATTVLAISNIGAPILAYTHHRVLAGPYHRNIEGNLAALDALMGSTEEAQAIVRQNHVGLVALCRGNAETSALVDWAPAGFLASLAGGNMPGWLEKIPSAADAALDIYRVRQQP
jgi:hypothetical protein